MQARFQRRSPHPASFFDVPGVLVCTANFDGYLTRVGVGWEAALGYAPDVMLGRPFADFIHPDDVSTTVEALAVLAQGGEVAGFENRYRAADGNYHWLRWNATADLVEESIYAVAGDVSAAKRFEEEVVQRGLRDELTGLPNRALFIDRVDTALAHLGRRRSHVAAVLVDLDDFHVVNDTLGRRAGDQVLIEVARRLESTVRASDTVARVGPDEFAVLCTDIDEAAVLEVTERIAADVAQPLEVSGRSLAQTLSAGVAVASAPRVGEMLVADADAALRRASARGGGRIEFFDRRLRTESVARMELHLALRAAIDRDELTLVYQPVVSLESGNALAFEALVRWRHPERGLLSPAVFIPLAEETGLICAVGHKVLEAACREAARWPAWNGDSAPAVTVNISAHQLADPDLVYTVTHALQSTGLDPSRLWLEVTETAVLRNLDQSLETLSILDGLGIRIGLDDFGEGQSSLSQLNLLTQVSLLKISASFVAQVHEVDSRAAAVVAAMVGLGRSIGLHTIAEGVETPAQLRALRSLGCAAAQGYLLARPHAPDIIEAWMKPAAFVIDR